MEDFGYKMVACSKLYLPGDFPDRLKSKRVEDLAKSVHSLGGFIHEPVVRKSDGKVLCGIDRIAAAFWLKQDMVRVKLVECSDEEAQRIEIDENLHRRYSEQEKEELIRRALEMPETIAPRIAYIKKPQGRKKLASTIAIEEVAMKLGVSPSTIRKKRYKKRPSEPPIRDLGMQLAPDWQAKAIAAKKVMEEDAAALRRQEKAITDLLANEYAVVQRPRLLRLLEVVSEAATLARDLTPSSLCPGCKGLAGVQEHCGFCLNAGYITKGQEAGIPRELWDDGVVQLNGRIVAVASLPGVVAEVGRPVDDPFPAHYSNDDVVAEYNRSIGYEPDAEVGSEEDWGF